MKKTMAVLLFSFQIFLLSCLWTNLDAASWLGNVGTYWDTPPVVELGSGPDLVFEFPPNSQEQFEEMARCVNQFPGMYLSVTYHTSHGKLIIDSMKCF